MILWIILAGLLAYFLLGEDNFKPFIALVGIALVVFLIITDFDIGSFLMDKFVMIVSLIATTAWLAIKGLGAGAIETAGAVLGGIWDRTLGLFKQYF